MPVYMELTVDNTNRLIDKLGSKRGRAGQANVRRPLRGIEIKEDTYATIRLITSNGSELAIFDSSDSTGRSSHYSNFLLQSVQEARMEKQQILETFGEPIMMLMGESPRFLDVTAILLNTNDFNWRSEWQRNYEEYLRGTKTVERGARLYLFYDDVIVEGFMVTSAVSETSQDHYVAQLNFQLFVTNARYTSLVGDPNYPIRDSMNLPEGVDLTSSDAYSKLRPAPVPFRRTPQQMAATAFTEYLKAIGAIQIQQQIKNVQSAQEAVALQKKYTAKLLGLSSELDNMIDLVEQGSDFLSDWKDGGPGKAFSNLGGKIADAVSGAASNIVKQITPSDPPKFDEQNEYYKILQEMGALDGLKTQGDKVLAPGLTATKEKFARLLLEKRKRQFYDGVLASQYSLADILKKGAAYSAPYLGQNLAEFQRNAAFGVYKAPRPPPELNRELPLRSKIADNLDEYTAPPPTNTEADNSLLGGNIGTLPKNPAAQLENEVCKRGGTMSPAAHFLAGTVSWKPGSPVALTAGGGSVQGAGGYVPGFSPKTVSSLEGGTGYGGAYKVTLGNGFRPTFSRVPGRTAGVAGAYGGSLGGGIGPGVGGALGGYGASGLGDPGVYQFGDVVQQQLAQNPFGPGGDPFGLGFGTFAGHPALSYLYTNGVGPDGSPISSGSSGTPGVFGGGNGPAFVASLNPGKSGKGLFSVQTLPGSLGSGGSCGPVVNNSLCPKRLRTYSSCACSLKGWSALSSRRRCSLRPTGQRRRSSRYLRRPWERVSTHVRWCTCSSWTSTRSPHPTSACAGGMLGATSPRIPRRTSRTSPVQMWTRRHFRGIWSVMPTT